MATLSGRDGFRDARAAAIFAAMAVVWTFPLVLHLGSRLPGLAPGDNVTGLWNLWWMRTALASGQDVFHTPFLFAPFGVDLTLNTHMALPAFVGATLLRPLSIVAALNVTTLVALVLNAWCTYRLVLRWTPDRGAAVVAGLIFGGSTYLSAHLAGHFNLIDAWVLPLFALAVVDALGGSRGGLVIAGLVLGGTVYVDYYYVVYELGLGLCLMILAMCDWSVGRAEAGVGRTWAARILTGAIVVDVILIVVIAATGDLTLTLGSRRILLMTTYNPLQVVWALVAIRIALMLRLRLTRRREVIGRVGPLWRAVGLVAIVSMVTASPIIWKSVRLILRGDYISQHYFWRSAPPGVDLASVVSGNPFSAVWGGAVDTLYQRAGMNVIESGGAWLGIVPLLLVAYAVRRRWPDRPVRDWTAIGAVYFLWALGPHLKVFGWPSGMILPETIVRYLPVASNARMPGRAIVVVDLAVAMLATLGLASWRSRVRRPAVWLVGAALLVAVDLVPAPFPTLTLDHPHLYDVLRDRPERGAVCELPVGVRDGFGEIGAFDSRVLFYQTIHERRIVGGFVARLPFSVLTRVRADPLMAALLHLSAPGVETVPAPALPDRRMATALFDQDGIRFVVLNRATAPSALVTYVSEELPLTLLDDDGDRALYLTGGW